MVQQVGIADALAVRAAWDAALDELLDASNAWGEHVGSLKGRDAVAEAFAGGGGLLQRTRLLNAASRFHELSKQKRALGRAH